MSEQPKYGLVLTGGGARTAYQAGVIRFISEMYSGQKLPITIFTGASAGAINTLAMAAGARDHATASKKLWDVWLNIRHTSVFRADILSLLRIGSQLIYEMVVGGNIARPRSNYLLDNAPLRNLLQKEILFSAIRLNIKKRLLDGVAVSATNYLTGTNITFYDAQKKSDTWIRSQRVLKPAQLTIDHLMASAALPVFFPPVPLDGSYYCDGSVRLISPLSPAIRLGADRILVIGIHDPIGDRSLLDINQGRMRRIMMADIAGLMLNSIFIDSLETDIERLERVNRSLGHMPEEHRKAHPDKLRPIKLLAINPSTELEGLAKGEFEHFPSGLQYVLRGIGATPKSGSQIVSHLAFNGSYTSKLLELGYEDARRKKDILSAFFEK